MSESEITNEDARLRGAPRPFTRILLAVGVAAIFIPGVISVGLRTDLAGYLRFAEEFSLSGKPAGSNYLFPQATIIVRALVPFGLLERLAPGLTTRQASWDISGVLVTCGFAVWTADLILVRLFAAVPRSRSRRTELACAGAALCLMVATPITMFTWHRHQLLNGYVSFNSFDSSTTIALKPFALLLFWRLTDYTASDDDQRRQVLLTAAISILAIHAKPSYSIVLLPAFLLLLAARSPLLSRRAIHAGLWGFALPSILYLAFQYLTSPFQAGLAITPLRTIGNVMAVHGQPRWLFVPLLLLSIAFPLIVMLVTWPRVLRDLRLQVAWLTFGVSLVFLALVTAPYGAKDYGDSFQPAQISLFVLFVASVEVLVGAGRLRHSRPASYWTAALVGTASLHLVAGVMLILRELTAPTAWW